MLECFDLKVHKKNVNFVKHTYNILRFLNNKLQSIVLKLGFTDPFEIVLFGKKNILSLKDCKG